MAKRADPGLRGRGWWLVMAAFLLGAGALVWWIANSGREGRPSSPKGPERPTDTAGATPQRKPAELETPAEPEDDAHVPPGPRREPSTQEARSSTATVFGEFRGPRGEPLTGVQVRFIDAQGEFRSAQVSESGYRIEGLPPGDCWANASRRGCKPTAQAIEDLRAGEERRVDLVLRPGVVIEVAVVTPDGRRFDGTARRGAGFSVSGSFTALEPVATLQPLGERVPWRSGGVGNPAGVGRFDPADPKRDPPELLGRLELEVDPPVHVALTSYQSVIASQFVPAPVARITFRVDPATFERELASVRFRLANPEGQPVLGVRPTLWLPGSTSLQLQMEPDGSAEWGGLPPGEYVLQWLAGGLYRSFTLAAGEELDLGTITLDAERTLRASVRLEDGSLPHSEPGEEGPYLTLGLIDPGTGSARIDPTYHLGVDEGPFSVTLTPDLYVLQWQSERYASSPFFADLREQDQVQEIVVHERCELVLVPDSQLWPGLEFELSEEQEIELHHGRFAGPWPVRLRLPPGELHLRIMDAAGRVRLERSVTLSSEPVRLDLDL